MSNKNKLILNYHDACIYESDLMLLGDGNWLNDACINYGMVRLFQYYKSKLKEIDREDVPIQMQFLDPSVVSYFMFQLSPEDVDDKEELRNLCSSWGLLSQAPVVSGSKKTKQTPEATILFLPINDHHSSARLSSRSGIVHGNHWSLVMMVFVRNGTSAYCFHFDSSPGYNRLAAKAVIQRIKNGIIPFTEYAGYGRCTDSCICAGETDDESSIFECRVPRQINGYDCGIHVLVTAEILLEEFLREESMQQLLKEPLLLKEFCEGKIEAYMRKYSHMAEMGIDKRHQLSDSIGLEASKYSRKTCLDSSPSNCDSCER